MCCSDRFFSVIHPVNENESVGVDGNHSNNQSTINSVDDVDNQSTDQHQDDQQHANNLDNQDLTGGSNRVNGSPSHGSTS